MYVTIEETAAYLEIEQSKVETLIIQGRIRVVHDGYQYLINRDQFNNHLEEVKKYREMIQAFLAEPIPQDIDVKDED